MVRKRVGKGFWVLLILSLFLIQGNTAQAFFFGRIGAAIHGFFGGLFGGRAVVADWRFNRFAGICAPLVSNVWAAGHGFGYGNGLGFGNGHFVNGLWGWDGIGGFGDGYGGGGFGDGYGGGGFGDGYGGGGFGDGYGGGGFGGGYGGGGYGQSCGGTQKTGSWPGTLTDIRDGWQYPGRVFLKVQVEGVWKTWEVGGFDGHASFGGNWSGVDSSPHLALGQGWKNRSATIAGNLETLWSPYQGRCVTVIQASNLNWGSGSGSGGVASVPPPPAPLSPGKPSGKGRGRGKTDPTLNEAEDEMGE